MISKMVYVYWLNNHAFTGTLNARQMRVTKWLIDLYKLQVRPGREVTPTAALVYIVLHTIQFSHIYRPRWAVSGGIVRGNLIKLYKAKQQQNGHVLKNGHFIGKC
jgi:hypothetical protein